MKIRDIQTGELYQLAPDSTLEIERTNPFFSDGGEQSLPMELPDTPQNRQLTGYPAELTGHQRPPSDRYVEIEDGAYHVKARQVVLSASRNGQIGVSYLLEQSDLYAAIGDRRLIDIFADETVPGIPTAQASGIPTLQEKIAWLDSLKSHSDDNFDIFPVAMTAGDSSDQGFGYRLLNAYGRIFTHLDGSGRSFYPEPVASTSQYYSSLLWLNAEDRTAAPMANDPSLNLQQGYYLTPFVRAIHVLERVIGSLGYEFVHDADPVIDRMVFVNNTIDSIVTDGGILLSDLVPDCSVSDLLDLFRYKFNMEFVCNDTDRTVTMTAFSAIMQTPPADLTPYLAGEPTVEYPEERRRLVLSPSEALSGDAAPAVSDILKKYACPRWDAVRGGWIAEGKRGCWPIRELVLDGNAGYDTGEDGSAPDTDEKKSPDTIPSMVRLNVRLPDGTEESGASEAWTFPFIGDERALHSRMSDDADDDSPQLKDRPGLDMMLLLPYSDFRGYPRGTLTDYDYYMYYLLDTIRTAGIGGSLCYHGTSGLFERYWRGRDGLARNALNTVRAKLLLPLPVKMSLSPLDMVLLRGAPLFIDTLSLTIGQDDAVTESTFLTASLQSPISSAPSAEQMPPSASYHWQLHRTFSLYTSGGSETSPEAVYLPAPAAGHAGTETLTQYQITRLDKHRNLGCKIASSDGSAGDTVESSLLPYLWPISGDYGWDIYNYTESPIYVYVKSWYSCDQDD